MPTIHQASSTVALEIQATCESCRRPFSYQTLVHGYAASGGSLFARDKSWAELGHLARQDLQRTLEQRLRQSEYPVRRCPQCAHAQSWMIPNLIALRRRLLLTRFVVPSFFLSLLGFAILGALLGVIGDTVDGLSPLGELGFVVFLLSPALAVGIAASRWWVLGRREASRILREGAESISAREARPALSLAAPSYGPGVQAHDSYLIRYEVQRMRQDLQGTVIAPDQFGSRDRSVFSHAQWRCPVCGTLQRGKPAGRSEAKEVLATPVLWLLGPLLLLVALWVLLRSRSVRCVMCDMTKPQTS
jgi:hypothetical protein